MKKFLFLGVVVLMLLPSCSIATEGASSDAPTSSAVPASTVVSETASSSSSVSTAPSDDGTLGDYVVTIESARLAEDYEGKKAILVKYKFTNNGEDSISFMFAIGDKAFQDGIQLETAIIMDVPEYNSENALKEIKKGATLEVESAYVLSNETSVVEIEASELISFNDTKVVKTFNISDLG